MTQLESWLCLAGVVIVANLLSVLILQPRFFRKWLKFGFSRKISIMELTGEWAYLKPIILNMKQLKERK